MNDKILFYLAVGFYLIQGGYLLNPRFSILDFIIIIGTTFLTLVCLIPILGKGTR